MNLTSATISRLHDNSDSARRLGEKYLHTERELNTKKYFDYRFMTPKAATDIFAADYENAYRQNFRRYIDAAEAPFKKGRMIVPNPRLHRSQKQITNLKREYTGMWIARQRADALGLPYPKFIAWAMECHMHYVRKKPPRPNQLMTGKGKSFIEKYITDKWKEWHTSQMVCSKLPQYRNEAFSHIEAQIAHRQSVMAQLRHLPGIGSACFLARTVPEEMAVAKWGEEVVQRAQDSVIGMTPASTAVVERDDLLPSCYALPFAFSDTSPKCQACVYRIGCGLYEAYLRKKMLKESGCEDPRLAEIRAQNNKRQVHRRAKVAALKSAAKAEATPASIEA